MLCVYNTCDLCFKQFTPTSIAEPTGGVASGDGSLEYALSGLLSMYVFQLCNVKSGSGAAWSHNIDIYTSVSNNM